MSLFSNTELTDEELHAQVDALLVEMNELFHKWDDRNADPMVTISLVMAKLTALAYDMYEEEEAVEVFLETVLEQGKQLHEEQKEGRLHVH